MSLEKHASSKANHVRVVFRVPAEANATSVDVVGEFTDWGLVSMRPNSDGSYAAEFDLEVGHAYRFRYLIDGTSWENDWAADNYVPNGYGGDDSVVDLRRTDETPPHLTADVRTANNSVVHQRRTHVRTPPVQRTAAASDTRIQILR
jgi:1,4-alpha-glucan branching enzyme